MTPIITAYEYDKLYYMVHRAYTHFFSNNSLQKNPKLENYQILGKTNLRKIEQFLEEFGTKNNSNFEELRYFFKKLKTSNFVEDGIKIYTEESGFCYIINRTLRSLDDHPIKLAYLIGPFLFNLNKYALEHPEKCLRKSVTLYRNMKINPLEKNLYTLDVGHIICYMAFTSTSLLRGDFTPTNKALSINKINNDNSIHIELIIQYNHVEGNISPGLYINDLSCNKGEEEVLLFPFTFFRLNKVTEIPNISNYCRIEMEIVNRRSFIEYELDRGNKYNISDLENLYQKSPLFIEDSGLYTFPNRQSNQINPFIKYLQPPNYDFEYNIIKESLKENRWSYCQIY